MPLDWNNESLAQGLRCYQAGQFFEAHEYWELIWLRCVEPEKTFLQSLIQITAAFEHFRRGEPAGAASLLRRSLARLENYPVTFSGVDVDELRTSLRQWLAALAQPGGKPAIPYPRIR